MAGPEHSDPVTEICADLQADLRAVAHAMADAAAAVTLTHFRAASLVSDNKAGAGQFDPVTIADRGAEEAMRAVLADLRPDDGILGEEVASVAGTSGLTWVLDPIDGTRAFISGLPLWGTLIGLDAGQGPVYGIVDQPYIGERFEGGFGRSVLTRGGSCRDLAVRACASLDQATLFSTFPEVGTDAEGAGFRAVSNRCKLTRYGTDCYGYMLIALGQVDLVIEAGLNAYDVQGPIAVIEAAGGQVTNWSGGPVHQGGQVLASGDARLHAAALALLAPYAD